MNQCIEVVPHLHRSKGEWRIDELYPWMARVMVPRSLIGTSGVCVSEKSGAAFVSAVGISPSEAVNALEGKAGSTILRAIIDRQLKEAKAETEAQEKAKPADGELRKTINGDCPCWRLQRGVHQDD